ncbi:conjugal transfer protein TraA [Actinomadura madurae]|uniref:helix-hairpin-helix domain-containing protein n=1 Tax=Actinomadura madurae TaxID=1993 RepID=UPI0020D23B43|nr:helix-hairpin-helix domain-containing protein [Actinomadura madurae]MCP9947854.1 conjugal transfer protein TraA [Actinomadura madurae]
MTDTPDQTPSPAERAARAAEAMRAAEAAADALDRRPAGGPAAGPAPAPPPGPGPAPGEGLRALTALFAETGVPAALAAPAVTRLGPDAAGRLRADPWRLLRVPGVQPRQADHFARALLGEDARPDDPRRGAALVLHLLTEAARAGHTVTPAADVLSGLGRLAFPDPRAAVEAALDEAEVLSLTEEPEFDEEAFGEDAEPPEPEETLGPARWALAEEAAAEGLRRLTLTAVPLLDDAAVKTLRDGLPEDRSLALTAALRTGVSILRGTPDGLARTAAGIADAAASRGVRTAIATPTDRAAADLAAADPALDAAAVTVTSLHRLLEPRDDPSAAPGAVVYGRGEQRPFDLDLVIVTDGAALDVELCAVLAEACPDGAHLVLCAEQGAPPPAGPGRPLDDLEASETVPVVALDAEPPSGPLGTLAEAVRGGELVAVDAPGREVVVVPAEGAAEAVHRAVQLVADSIPRAFGLEPGDVQVVAPGGGRRGGRRRPQRRAQGPAEPRPRRVPRHGPRRPGGRGGAAPARPARRDGRGDRRRPGRAGGRLPRRRRRHRPRRRVPAAARLGGARRAGPRNAAARRGRGPVRRRADPAAGGHRVRAGAAAPVGRPGGRTRPGQGRPRGRVPRAAHQARETGGPVR